MKKDTYIILNAYGAYVGQVVFTYPKGSFVRATVFDELGNIYFQGQREGTTSDDGTSALSTATIGGIRLYDHCITDPYLKGLLQHFRANQHDLEELSATNKLIDKAGAHLANFENDGWQNLYYIPGLDRLTHFGFKVIKAL